MVQRTPFTRTAPKARRPRRQALARAATLACMVVLTTAAVAPALAGDIRFYLQTTTPQTLAGSTVLDITVTGLNNRGDITGNINYGLGRVAFIQTASGYQQLSNPAEVQTTSVGLDDNGRLFGTFYAGTSLGLYLFTQATGAITLSPGDGMQALAMDRSGQWLLARSSTSGDTWVGRVGTFLTYSSLQGTSAINARGDIAGHDSTGAYVLRDGVRLNSSLPGTGFTALNASGHAVGSASYDVSSRAVLFDGITTRFLSNEPSFASDISDTGQVVGSNLALRQSTAVAFDPRHGAQSLADLLFLSSTLVLRSATAVNDHGQIAGTAVASDSRRLAYVLTPEGRLRWDGSASRASFLDAAQWDSRVGLAPSKFVDVVFAPAASTVAVADRSMAMKSLVIGAIDGAATARLELAAGARLDSTAAPVVIEARGLVVGNGVLAGLGGVINRGSIGEAGGAPLALQVLGDLDNRGLVTGSGSIAATLINRGAGAGVRVQGGEALGFIGAIHTNADAGRMEIRQGGELSFSGALVNQGGAFIRIDNGTLRTGSLENGGLVQIAFGGASFFGDVRNAAATDANRGRIVASGAADVTFWDRVHNLGEVRASAGSRMLYFRPVTGTGSFTSNGGGYHRFEGGYSPTATAAPGAETAARMETPAYGISEIGDVQFASTLSMAIGGTVPGSEHDQIVFTGSVLFDAGSRLAITLTEGYAPADGSQFQLFRYTLDMPQGQFDGLELPSLGAHLYWDSTSLYTSGVLGVTAVPEPSAWALMLAGLAAVGGLALRRRPRGA